MAAKQIALTRRPAASLADGERSFIGRAPIDSVVARREHDAYCDWLTAKGVTVVCLTAEESMPDSVFIEDVAVVLPELAIITTPGAVSRRQEPAQVVAALARQRRCEHLPAAATLDGGDVLRVGRRVLVGITARSNPAGHAALRDLLLPLGYEVASIGVQGCLHLKTACTALDDRCLIVNPGWVDAQQFAPLEAIAVHPLESFAANVLRVGTTVGVNAAFPRTADRLRSRGYDVNKIHIAEFHKAEAGLTCLSLLFDDLSGC